MNNKILALCSGGFDSILMLNIIRDNHPGDEIHTLFFDYGQKSCEQERECSEKASNKLGCIFHEVSLPKFDWTSSSFYSPEYSGDGEYLEMRNLVFISYALSFCESLGCSTLYMAVLKSLGYYDTSEKFLSKVRSIAEDKGVTIETPFSTFEKRELCLSAFRSSIQIDDFFSCDNPVEGKPCGKCPDCLAIKDIFGHVDLNTPAKVWGKTFDPYNKEFQRLIRSSPIHEMRVLVNNDCQLKCKHCYYGFSDMKQPRLSLDEFRDVFIQARDLGINDFHFSGKEPLFDDFIFEVTKVLREVHPESDCTVVTNGINIPKYANLLKEYRYSKVFLSVDDVGGTSFVRSVHSVTDKALKALNEVGIPVEVFIDLHENNYDKVDYIIDLLNTTYGVKDFYVRTISIIGNAKNGVIPLTSEELDTTYHLLFDYAESHSDVDIHFTVMAPYMYDLLNTDFELRFAIEDVIGFAYRNILPNFTIFPQMYCGKYESQITLTPDGFIHGCASEVSSKDYDLLSPGNVRYESLSSLIRAGKDLCIKCNCNEVDEQGNLKFFSCTCSNPIDQN